MEQKAQKASSSIFTSKVSRFIDEKTDDQQMHLGPGSYDSHIQSSIQIKRQSKPQQRKAPGNIQWVKVNTAPSIPTRMEAQGYNEGAHGELIKQKNIDVNSHTGANSDLPGPGEYELGDIGEQKNVAICSSFKSKTKREVFKVKHEIPGPGAYEHQQLESKDEEDLFKNSSVFASKTTRGSWMKGANHKTPGPGYYSYETDFKKQVVPDKVQNFGSSITRPCDQPLLTSAMPGPGHYGKEEQFVKRRYMPGTHGPFDSTTRRFATRGEVPLPGPGAYLSNESQIFKQVKQKAKLSGSYGVFGTTSKRLKNQISTVPGPGAYNAEPCERVGIVRRSDKRMAPFASKTKRKSIIVSSDVPPPGTYELKPEWVKDSNKKNLPANRFMDPTADVFISRAPKDSGSFLQQAIRKSQNEPGPGAYNLSTSPLHQMANTEDKGFGTVRRFIESERSDSGIGPGQYTVYSEPLVKRSFNVTIM